MRTRVFSPKRAALAVLALCVCVAIFAAAYSALMPQGVEGSKDVTVEIVALEGYGRTVELTTDAEFLRQALEEQDLIQGDESEYGLYVRTVDGITADDANQEWWCFTKSGESLMTGVDTTPIADGDHYEITLTVGY